jgi:enediyne biosynthesis protein E4
MQWQAFSPLRVTRYIVATALLLNLFVPSSGQLVVYSQGIIPPIFSEQTSAAGLALFTTSTTETIDTEEMMPGAAAGDFNRDGWIDLFALGGGVVADKLYINNGDGTFTDHAAEWGVAAIHVGAGVAVGDYDKDGWLDIFVTSHGVANNRIVGQHRLYRNTGKNSFLNVATAAGVNRTSTTIPDGYSAAFGDYDLDGDLDLAVAGWEWSTPGVHLFQNNGDGTFTEVTTQAGVMATQFAGFTPCFNDMNGDRYPELLVAADFGTSRYFVNQRNGTFVTTAAGVDSYAFGMGSAVADFNNDGQDDWFITSIYDENPLEPERKGNLLYYNQGNHQFVEKAEPAGVADGHWGWGVVAIDVNHDGQLDLLETNGWKMEPKFQELPGKLWLNNGNETFSEVAAAAGYNLSTQGRGIIHLDYDNDGDQDFVVTSREDELRLYRNDLDNQNANWLHIRLDTHGTPSLAPDGIGARIRVRTGESSQYRTLNGCPSYLSQSELAAHFGLGTAQTVDEIVVTWPDGEITRLINLAVNQTITISSTQHLYLPILQN